METKQPTQKQIKEFWEWCGFGYIGKKGIRDIWDAPDGGIHYDNLPTIDLNNLFRHAIPKMLTKLGKMGTAVLVNDAVCTAIDNHTEFALALFWAIWKVKDGQ